LTLKPSISLQEIIDMVKYLRKEVYMANIQSQVKRIITNRKAEDHNFTFKASMRTAMKKVKTLLSKKDLPGATASLAIANKLIDKSVSHGIQKTQTAARQKSRLMKFFTQQTKLIGK
jgi:small subunit ribosomal protein S20